MKPFALESVLSYRKRLEDIAQLRLAEAKKVHQLVRQKLQEEEKLLYDLSTLSEKMQQEGMLITELILFEERILQVKANVKAINKTLTEKAEIVRSELSNLIEKARERQSIERLKERQNAAWRAYLDKKETLAYDEVAILRHDSGRRE